MKNSDTDKVKLSFTVGSCLTLDYVKFNDSRLKIWSLNVIFVGEKETESVEKVKREILTVYGKRRFCT